MGKVNNSQSGFFTIADLPAKQGYNTSFIYGGENTLITWQASSMVTASKILSIKKDYQNPKFTATWGVSDEDLI